MDVLDALQKNVSASKTETVALAVSPFIDEQTLSWLTHIDDVGVGIFQRNIQKLAF